MKRQGVNFLVDAIALAGLVFLMATGLFLRFILPPGSGKTLSVWGLTRHEWGDIHFYIAVFIVAILSLHLALHWRWIVCAIQNKPREGSGVRVAWGVAGLFILLLISATPFLSPIEKNSTLSGKNHKNHMGFKSHSGEEHVPSAQTVRGSMTLAEVEQSTNVPINHILKELGIRDEISPDERMGPLRHKYGFQMETVRKIIKNYHRKSMKMN